MASAERSLLRMICVTVSLSNPIVPVSKYLRSISAPISFALGNQHFLAAVLFPSASMVTTGRYGMKPYNFTHRNFEWKKESVLLVNVLP